MPNRKPVAATWFRCEKAEEDLYRLSEVHYWEWNRANCWLLRGRDLDLIIDTGLGVASLLKALPANGSPLPGKRLMAVASHVHFDHAGGLFEFEERAIHENEAEALRSGDQEQALCSPEGGWVQDEHFEKLPTKGFQASGFRLQACEPTLLLREGGVLDLGDRVLEVLHLPGHSPGCIALYDGKSGWLFSGDVVYDGQLLDELPGSDHASYCASMERLLRLPVTAVYPGHYPAFGPRRLQELARSYLESHLGLRYRARR